MRLWCSGTCKTTAVVSETVYTSSSQNIIVYLSYETAGLDGQFPLRAAVTVTLPYCR